MNYRTLAIHIPAALLLTSFIGCSSSVRVTDPKRTATEQFLLSQAVSEAVEKLAINALRGRRVFVDAQYFAASEQSFVIGELRARLLESGVQLLPDREKSEIVMEVRSGGVGVDRTDFLLGVPSILLRGGTNDGTGTSSVPVATPELALIKNIDQRGIASVAYVAYWRETGEVVGASGPTIGTTNREDWWFLGLGRSTVGDIPPAQIPED